MATFHAKGKVEFIVPLNEFGVSHVTKKCLCAMFSVHLEIIHVFKDDAYDANNNVIKSIYQVPVIGDLGLKWRVQGLGFKVCLTCMYNVVHKHDNLTRATIHLDMHDHPMVEGCSR
jgi:hypothetical protein